MKTKTAGILVICKENSKLFLVKRAPHHFYHANEIQRSCDKRT